MNEEKLVQFVQWLPTKIKELEGAKPEQIVEIINQMGQTKEGLTQLDSLLQQFEKELKTISMKNGGKFEYIKMLRNGGCPSCGRSKIEKAQSGSSDLGGYYRAKNYHKKYSDENTLRKIQNFLAARGYYNGDLDGLYGQQTFNAIKAYQKDNNLTSDGMWGEDTNSIHRVLNATNSPYRKDASGRSGAHRGSEPGANTTHFSSKMSANDLYRSINTLKEQFYADPEAFWTDNGDMSQWREFLYKTKQGKEILGEFFDATPDDIRQRIDPKKLLPEWHQEIFNKHITDGTNAFARRTMDVLPYVAAPLSFASAPLATVMGIAGGLAGSKVGKNVVHDLNSGAKDTTETDTYNGRGGVTGSVITNDNGKIDEAYGELIGSALGGSAGAYMSRYLDLPKMPGTGFERTSQTGPKRSYRSRTRDVRGRLNSSSESLPKVKGDPRARWAAGDPFGNGGKYASYESNIGPGDWLQGYMEYMGGNPAYKSTVTWGFKKGGKLK